MHHQVDQVLNGPTYVTILSLQEKKNPKIGQALIIITSKAPEDLFVGLLMGKGLVSILDLSTLIKFGLKDHQSKAYCDHFSSLKFQDL
jgi:hypothetical protein